MTSRVLFGGIGEGDSEIFLSAKIDEGSKEFLVASGPDLFLWSEATRSSHLAIKGPGKKPEWYV